MAILDTNPPPAAEENYIRKLPVELLIQIFLSAYLTTDQHIRFQVPFKLLSVTSVWRKIALREPQLWTYTFYRNRWLGRKTASSVKAISFKLVHSKDRPLEIAIDLGSRPVTEMMGELIKMLLQHRNRWVALSLYADYDYGLMGHVL
ncbi:hypothetical protein M407DRAFT_17284 [Tulasnella calospora MUT 4182]|uniref:Uncharacterized protein n=1 Tax=Tulasnella calospora MUT 4182 TaxID=1051891 RepID=A0A0C3QXZ8_9AGAM|nr:hypothetical protein M407DRAFT_17284 [Tulasnella calospora MUT 4182]